MLIPKDAAQVIKVNRLSSPNPETERRGIGIALLDCFPHLQGVCMHLKQGHFEYNGRGDRGVGANGDGSQGVRNERLMPKTILS